MRAGARAGTLDDNRRCALSPNARSPALSLRPGRRHVLHVASDGRLTRPPPGRSVARFEHSRLTHELGASRLRRQQQPVRMHAVLAMQVHNQIELAIRVEISRPDDPEVWVVDESASRVECLCSTFVGQDDGRRRCDPDPRRKGVPRAGRLSYFGFATPADFGARILGRPANRPRSSEHGEEVRAAPNRGGSCSERRAGRFPDGGRRSRDPDRRPRDERRQGQGLTCGADRRGRP